MIHEGVFYHNPAISVTLAMPRSTAVEVQMPATTSPFELRRVSCESGADRLSGEWAASKGIQVEARPAEWKKHGRAAGPIRNSQMLDEKPELVVAFPSGKGTADMVKKAKQAGLDVVMVGGEGS